KSVVNEEDFTIHFDLKPNAQRFEPGTMNFAGIYALGAALELIFEVGIDNIRHRIHELNDLLYHGLIDRNLKVVSSMDEENRSGILSFLPGNDSEQLYQFFINNSVIVSLRAGKIRVSPHFYNNETDIQNFFSVLDEYLTTTRA
ncbi:MAG: aminotransferase, partial [Deltaproteobacteria bacterium]